MKAPQQPTPAAAKNNARQPFLQRKPASADAAERPFISRKCCNDIQPKLTVNRPGDAYEQEADRMADRVMRMPMAAPAAPPMISRMRAGAPVQRKGSAQLASQLNSSKGSGDRLPSQTLASMNQVFGADFSTVRIHTGSQAAEMSQGIEAKAFTHGSDVYFNQGQYSPESSEGKRLLGHELTHVVQQQAGRVQEPLAQQNRRPGIQPVLRSDAPTVQRKKGGSTKNNIPKTWVGSVQEGYSLQDTEGGINGQSGKWHKPGQGGYSRLMEGAAGGMVEEMAKERSLQDQMLRHVVADLSGLPKEERFWLNRAKAAKSSMDDWYERLGTPPSIQKYVQERVDSANAQVEVIKKCGVELEQKTNQFNSFVPQGNAFIISIFRLSSMQSLIGATNNEILAEDVYWGLIDAEEVMKRYQGLFEGGNRTLTTEKLDMPEHDESVEQATREMIDASQNLDAKYMGFQTTVLAGQIGEIRDEYKNDVTRLAEIEQVKQFVRGVGQTVDFTMSFVRGAPTAVANVTEKVNKGQAMLNAARNKKDISAGKRPRFNPTYVTTDANGRMVVRNMQTGIDRDMETGDKASAPSTGIGLPTSVSDVLGGIADFVYADEVKEINLRLEEMKTRISQVQAIIETTLIEQRIAEYQNALNVFATKSAALQRAIEDRRREYREFGMQLDRLAQVDKELGKNALGVAKGAERFTTIMTMAAAIQEMLTLGHKSLLAAPSDIEEWFSTVRQRRYGTPTDGELETAMNIHQQIEGFKHKVNLAQEIFGKVSEQARTLVGEF